LLARFTPGNPLLPAKYWLRGVINQRLRGHVEFCFNLDSAHQIVPSLMPDHLLTTLWVQFSLAVALHKKYRRCSACQDWFEMSPEVARSNRKFCSIACKNRTFRARVDQARKLHGEGRGLREIAKTLKTKVAVIKTWIGTTSREK